MTPERRPSLPQASIPGLIGRKSDRIRILEAAAEYLAVNGFEHLPATVLAQNSRVSEERLREQFPTEEAMFAATLNYVDARNITAYFSGNRSRGWRGLDAWADLLDAVVAQPGALQLYSTMRAQAGDTSHPAHDWVSTHRDLCADVLRHAMETGIEDGEISAELPVEELVYQMIAMTEGVQLHWLATRGKAKQGAPLRGLVNLARYRYGIPAPAAR